MRACLKTYLMLLPWIAVYLVAAKIIGDMTRMEIPGWYAGLIKPPLNPPDIAFGIVWTLLYISIAVAGWRLGKIRHTAQGKCLLTLFAVQTLVNWAWSYIFFYYHLTFFAFVWLLVLIALVAALIYKSDRLNRRLLSPYLAWICFAAYLNGMIWYLNR